MCASVTGRTRVGGFLEMIIVSADRSAALPFFGGVWL